MSLTTRSSTRRLSEVTRHLVIPSGIVTTGWPAVAKKLSQLGIVFDGWQQGASKLTLGKRADGLYAATVGGVYLSLPRQVGKTFMLGALMFALCLLNRGFTVLWTAHRLKTAGETFKAMQALARRKRIAPLVANVRRGSGDWAIEFTNGARILFGARETGFGRGFAEVDAEIYDEAQILTDKALDDMLPAANASKQPAGALVIYAGTPPTPSDPSEVFTRARTEALSGQSDDLLWIECSAPPGTDPDTWPAGHVDFDAIAAANPSYPLRTPRASILRMAKQLSKASLRREGLGLWDDTTTRATRLISAEEWGAISVGEAPPEGVRSFGVAFNLDGDKMSLAGAIRHDGQRAHLEVIGTQAGALDIAAVADWLEGRWRDASQITISGKAGAEVLQLALRDRKVPARVIHVASAADYFTSTSMLLDSVRGQTITVPAGIDDALSASAAVCDKKTRGGSGAWGWQATTPDGDETPLEAIGLALWGARTSKRRPGRRQAVL